MLELQSNLKDTELVVHILWKKRDQWEPDSFREWGYCTVSAVGFNL